jgi:hypothetical protein
MPESLNRLGARLVQSTVLLDRAYRKFDALRSLLVLGFASDSFLEFHCKLAYDASTVFRADSEQSRSGLFPFEVVAIREHFPAPPARVLLGGAGGGREAYGLIEMGYEVVAFEPALVLAETMRDRTNAEFPTLKAFCAGYEDLPIMPAFSGHAPVDLEDQPPFDAAILGWCSFSHLILDSARSKALASLARLTRGPILVSYFPERAGPGLAPTGRGVLNALRRRALRRGNSMFTTGVGYARLLSETSFREIADRAGVETAYINADRGSEWPYAIVRRRA